MATTRTTVVADTLRTGDIVMRRGYRGPSKVGQVTTNHTGRTLNVELWTIGGRGFDATLRGVEWIGVDTKVVLLDACWNCADPANFVDGHCGVCGRVAA